VPPVQPTTWFNLSFTLSSPALVVFVVTAGGQCCVSLTGVSGMHLDAIWNESGGCGLIFAHATLQNGSYRIAEKSTNNDIGSQARADVLAVFAFSSSASVTVVRTT